MFPSPKSPRPGRAAGVKWRTSALLLVAALASGCGANVAAPIKVDVTPEFSWGADSPAWSPDGKHIAYSWYVRDAPSEMGIWIIDTSGVVGPQVLKGIEWHQTDWSPDGTHLAMTYSGNKGIYTVTTAGTDLTPLSTMGLRPRWSPSGNELAFEKFDSTSAGSIWIVSKDGTGLRSLAPTDTASWRDPDWSPDGTRLVHIRQPSPAVGGAVFVMDTNGQNAQRLTTDNGYMDPAWSPDGQWIAYFYSPSSIYIMRADGTDAHYLVDGETPCWSPDSRRIVFTVGSYYGFSTLYAIDIATLRIRQLIK